VFVDDILVFSPDPKEIFEKLKANYKYEFEDISEPEYYSVVLISTLTMPSYCMSAKKTHM
jgi:hypothetical protein